MLVFVGFSETQYKQGFRLPKWATSSGMPAFHEVMSLSNLGDSRTPLREVRPLCQTSICIMRLTLGLHVVQITYVHNALKISPSDGPTKPSNSTEWLECFGDPG